MAHGFKCTIYLGCGFEALQFTGVSIPSELYAVLPTGHAPEPCHSHAAAAILGHMFVFGGTRGYCQQACPGLYILDLKTQVWEATRLPQAELEAAPQTSPLPCFSHSLTAVGGLLVLAGGCHTLGAGQ